MTLATLQTRSAFGQETRLLSFLCSVLLFLETSYALPGANQSGISFRLSHFVDTSVTTNLLGDQRDVLSSRILPSVRHWLLRTLTDVTREDLASPILLRSDCLLASRELIWQGGVYCDGSCADYTKCGHQVVPDEHLKCQRCVRVTGCQQCQHCEEAKTGSGVADTDYLLYVTAVNDSNCRSPDVLYTSVPCSQDLTYNRPIAGNINICPGAFRSSLVAFEYQVSLFLREMIRLLGFRTELFPYYRDSDGIPLTPRDDNGKPILQSVLGQPSELASAATIRVSKTPWVTATESVNVEISQTDHLIVTPTVVREARNHFGCNDLTGLALESTGNDAFSFWNKRLMLGELMTSDPQPGAIVSSITLALLQDTGWYGVSYTQAGYLPWGNKFGCTFTNGSCLAYALENAAVVQSEQMLLAKNWSAVVDVEQMQWGAGSEFILAANGGNRVRHPFHSFPFSSVVDSVASFTRCTYDHRFLARSNLNRYDTLSPLSYFGGLYNGTGYVSTNDGKYYRGADQETSSCPYFQSVVLPGMDYRQFHDCKNPFVGLKWNYFREQHTLQSFCVNFASHWTYNDTFLHPFNLDHISSGCYKINCYSTSHSMSIQVMDTAYSCSHSGAIIDIHVVISGIPVSGSLICPPYDTVCAQHGCPNGCNSRGTCRVNTKGKSECVCSVGFSGLDCSEITGYGLYTPTGPIVLPVHLTTTSTPTSESPGDDGVKWTARVIANFVATFAAAIIIIVILVWLFKCGGMRQGKMKGPPSRTQQREQRRLAQQTVPHVVDTSNEVSVSYPPAYRVRPDGSQPLYPVQVSIGSYSYTPPVDDNDVVT